MPSLLPFITWCNQTAVGTWIRTGSGWAFPIIETFHILALALLFGTTLIVDLRLLGAGMKRQRVSRIAAELWPLMMGSLALILVTGVLLFLSEAIKVYGNAGFRFKMVCLVFALTFHFTIFRRVALADERTPAASAADKVVALVSMALWLGVGVGGRAIGFI